MLASPNDLLSSDASSNKLLLSGSGTINLPSGTNQSAIATIPHGYGDSNLIWQVVVKETDGTAFNNFVTPYYSNDTRLEGISYVDSTNLYVQITTQSSGSAWPATSWNYTYRILVP